MVNKDYGVDLKSDFNFADGDLNLVKYEENICQAIQNRLSTIKDALGLFYYNYGGFFILFPGWKKDDETLSLMKIELESLLKQDEKIGDFETNLSYTEKGDVVINIVLKDGEDTSLDFIMSNDGIEMR